MGKSKEFDQYKFILSALSKNEVGRYHMQNPMWYSELKSIVSTDGRRMHMWELDEPLIERFGLIGKGTSYLEFAKVGKDYRVIVGEKIENPIDVKRVIPTVTSKLELLFNGRYNPDQNVPRFLINTLLPISLEYLIPLYGESWEVFTEVNNPDKHAVLFKYNVYSAVIMPFILND